MCKYVGYINVSFCLNVYMCTCNVCMYSSMYTLYVCMYTFMWIITIIIIKVKDQ